MRQRLAGLALAAAACAAPQVGPFRPEEGGWREISGEHFVVLTDLPAAEGRRALDALERTQGALLAFAWPGHAPPPGRQTVVALADGADLPGRAGSPAGIRPGTDGLESVWVAWGLPGAWGTRPRGGEEPPPPDGERDDPRALLAGDRLPGLIADRLTRWVLGERPRWLVLGLQEYLASVRLDPGGRSAELGYAEPAALAALRAEGFLEVQRLLAAGAAPPPPLDGPSRRELLAFARSGWLLAHYLYSTQKEAFAEYQRRLVNGANPEHALYALRDRTPGKLDAAVRAQLAGGRWPELRAPAPAPRPARERPLGPVEVHLARARLALAVRASFERAEEAAREEVEAALRIVPSDAEARRLHAMLAPPSERLLLAREAALADPLDWRSWLALFRALPAERPYHSERVASLARARELSGVRRARLSLGQAELQLAAGRPDLARVHAVEAVRLDPYDPEALRLQARMLASRGYCAEAAFEEACAFGAGAYRPEEYRARLAELARGCVEAH